MTLCTLRVSRYNYINIGGAKYCKSWPNMYFSIWLHISLVIYIAVRTVFIIDIYIFFTLNCYLTDPLIIILSLICDINYSVIYIYILIAIYRFCNKCILNKNTKTYCHEPCLTPMTLLICYIMQNIFLPKRKLITKLHIF